MDEAGPKPETIRLTVRSWRGPFNAQEILRLAPRVALVQNGAETLEAGPVSAGPWRDEDGLAVPGALTAELELTGTEPGGTLRFTLDGSVPARPGTYTSICRIGTVTVPIRADVAASAGWGVLFMLGGLSIVNVIAGFAGESETRAKLFDALQAKQAAHAWIEAHPVADGRLETAAEMDRNFDRAVEALSRPRAASLVDHRMQEAAPALQAASDQVAALRGALQGRTAVAVIVEDLEKEWTGLQADLHRVVKPPSVQSGLVPTPFARQVDGVIERLRQRLLVEPEGALSNDLDAQLIRVRLTMGAGEADAARGLAGNARLWLHRAARTMLESQLLIQRQIVQGGTIIRLDEQIRADADTPGLSPEGRQAALAGLRVAEEVLNDVSGLDELRLTAGALNGTANQLERDLADAQVTLTRRRLAADDSETSFAAVEAATAAAQADPDRSAASKLRHLDEILAIWRGQIERVEVPESKRTLEAAYLDAALAVKTGDLAKVSGPMRALYQAWGDYGGVRVQLIAGRSMQGYCRRYADRIRNRLGELDQALLWQQPGPRFVAWDREIDRLRLDLGRLPEDGQCLERLLALGQEEIDLSKAIYSADKGLPIQAAQGAVRPLTLTVPAPKTERTAGRPMLIAVEDLERDWQQGVLVRLDFGDGSAPVIRTAPEWRQAGVTHVFDRTRTVIAHVTAAERFTDAGAVIGDTLGEGTVPLQIDPAPELAAQRLADRFLSARFALALIVASLVYYWRFHARPGVFGARSYDYVEAFAVGFAVNAAVAELPAAIARFLPG